MAHWDKSRGKPFELNYFENELSVKFLMANMIISFGKLFNKTDEKSHSSIFSDWFFGF